MIASRITVANFSEYHCYLSLCLIRIIDIQHTTKQNYIKLPSDLRNERIDAKKQINKPDLTRY